MYTYVDNNPLIHTDPTGHLKEVKDAIIEARDGGIDSAIYWDNRSKLGSLFKEIYQDEDNNQFKYLFGLATMTSDVEENSIGKSEWAIDQLYSDEVRSEIDFGLSFFRGGASSNNLGAKASTGGKSKNNMKYDPDATGEHSTYKRDPNTGEITNWQEWIKSDPRNPNPFSPGKRFDGQGAGHYNKQT
ncbi:hypothetical protein [Paenibacillus rigui]|uniref:hypothetical protein n=1 Tax=Paenibacillus rigui TaxID=554312 RepID=UPI000B8A6A69|nr:hypothetical protein [Paenibacillus rigui]